MHEHIESLIIAANEALRRAERRLSESEPRRRRPRAARSTYIPVRRDAALPHLVH
ncbi:hypothetical protein JNB62_15260 [Microbacterium jejuense]|uniref:Uncharacterized protein n=1 Tax=Microbacterium jejuense TaxID=1263637 RepID=A0ABS7HQ11_9MICO|nr:hypothetical protein [Microbacterium jejuense]MBW9095046.1 hypothetical protein [Microbacterium jejuense]